MVVDERIWALFKRHWRHTVTYWSVFFTNGLCIAFLGPTVGDLQCQTRSTLQEITWVFFVQQFFLLCGCACGGLNKKKLIFSLCALFSSTLMISVVFVIIPFCRHLALLAFVMAIAGMAMGVVETTANVQLVKLYQKDAAIFLQILHFFVGLGALIVPLLVDPFLSDGSCLDANMTSNGTSLAPSHKHPFVILEAPMLHNMSLDPLPAEGVASSWIGYAFWIMALINLPIPITVLLLMYYERLLPCPGTSTLLLDRDRSDPVKSPPVSSEQQNSYLEMFRCSNLSKLRDRPASFFLLHVVGGAILFFIDGIVGIYGAFVFTYAVSPPLEMGHSSAGWLNSVFWAAVTVGRLASVYLSYRFTPMRLIIVSLVAMVVVQCMLLIFHYSSVVLFIGTALLGLCISGVSACVLVFTEQTLDYKGCAVAVLVTSGSTGEMVLQVVVGSEMHNKGRYAFPLCSTIASFLAFGLFLLLLYVRHIHIKSQNELSKDVAMKDIPSSGGPELEQ